MKTVEVPAPEVGLRPPTRPGFFRVGWATFSGYVFALAVLVPVGILAYFLGIDAVDFGGVNPRGAFYRFDAWSYLAEACVGVFVTAVTAYMVRLELRRHTDWEVSFGFAFVVILLTGYAPAAALTPLYGATALVSLCLATVAVWLRCEPGGAEPMAVLAAVPQRHRRRVVIGLAVAVPLMAAYALAYGATHPLRYDGSVGFMPNGTAVRDGSGPPRYERDPGAVERYVFPIENLGPSDPKDLALLAVEGNPVFQVQTVGFGGSGANPHPPAALKPLDQLELPTRATRYVVLEFRQGPTCVGSTAELDAVRLRYAVLGGTFEERMPLADPPTIRC
jgi:hypothetical protein